MTRAPASNQKPSHYVVPHLTEPLRERRARVCLAVFVINEGDRLRAQLKRMESFAPLVDIVIADGGSTDGSTDLRELERRGVRALLVKQGPGALGAQMVMAFDWAVREGYNAIITMDGNNKDDPAAIPDFLQALEGGFQHVQGSRFVAGGRAVNTPFSRKWAVRLIHAPLIRVASGWPYTDTTNGFRAYARELLEDPRVAPFRPVFSGYELHYYLAIRATRLGYRVCEVPVTRVYPERGGAPTKISLVRGNLRVLRALFAACLHRYDPPKPAGDVQSVRAAG